jgi:catechol 2,3-dioxygenase-like lactoylglutathione lyase family enzyme
MSGYTQRGRYLFDSAGRVAGFVDANGNEQLTPSLVSGYSIGSSLSLTSVPDAIDTPTVTVANSSGYGPVYIDYTDPRLQYWGNLRWSTGGAGVIGDSSTATTKYYTPMYWSTGVVGKSVTFRCQHPTSNRLGFRIYVKAGNGGGWLRNLPRGGNFSITTTNGSATISAASGVLQQYLSGSIITAPGVPAGATISKIKSDGTQAVLSAAATASASVTATFMSGDGLGFVDAAGVKDITLTFPGINAREFIFASDGGIHTVTSPSGVFFSPNVTRGRRALLLADSWGEAGLGGVMQAVHMLGYTDIHLSANGGTGYIATNAGTGGKNFLTRIAEYASTSAGIDDFFIFGSLNDTEGGSTPAQIAAQAAQVWDAISTGRPDARIYISGVQFANQHFTFTRDDTNAALVAAAASRQAIKNVVVPKDWVTGYAWIDSPDGNLCDFYTSDSAGNHLTAPEGYSYWSRRYVAAKGAA